MRLTVPSLHYIDDQNSMLPMLKRFPHWQLANNLSERMSQLFTMNSPYQIETKKKQFTTTPLRTPLGKTLEPNLNTSRCSFTTRYCLHWLVYDQAPEYRWSCLLDAKTTLQKTLFSGLCRVFLKYWKMFVYCH